MMFKDIEAFSIADDGEDEITIEMVGSCPLCHKTGKFNILFTSMVNGCAYSLYFCPTCEDVFMAYSVQKGGDYGLAECYPSKYGTSNHLQIGQ